MSDPVGDKMHWLLDIIEEGKKGLEVLITENAKLRQGFRNRRRARVSRPYRRRPLLPLKPKSSTTR